MRRTMLPWLKDRPAPAFFALTFLLAWGLWVPLGLLAPQHYLLSLPGAWAPTVSGLLLIGLREGRPGLRRFVHKILRWRVGAPWYLVVLFGIAAIACLAVGLGALMGIPVPALTLPAGLPPGALPAALPLLFLINIVLGGPLAEDIGWRGYILPVLRQRMSALPASLLIGIVWAIWHLPYFVFPGWSRMVGEMPFLWFALLTTGWSVLFAWVYVNTESILMPVLFHASINTTLGTLGVLGQGSGSLAPLILNTLLTWAAVGLVVARCGKDLQQARPRRTASHERAYGAGGQPINRTSSE